MPWLLISFVSLFLPLGSVPLGSVPQDPGRELDEQAKFRAQHEEKKAKKFVASGGWVLDYDKARARAAAEDKLLFIYFTRSFAP